MSGVTGPSCWLCGRAVEDPPEVIGQYVAGSYRVAHRRCWRTLGEMELQLAEGSGSGPRAGETSGLA